MDADCRLQRERRSQPAIHSVLTFRSCVLRHAAVDDAGSCRPCNSNRERRGQPPEMPPCDRPSFSRSASLWKSVSSSRHSSRQVRERARSNNQLGLGPVQFDNQQRFAIHRIAGMDEILRGLNRRAIHNLHAARNKAPITSLTHWPAAHSTGNRSKVHEPSPASAECAQSLPSPRPATPQIP